MAFRNTTSPQNLFLQSEDITTASWTPVNAFVDSATLLRDSVNATAVAHILYQVGALSPDPYPTTGSSYYVGLWNMSFSAKAGTKSWVYVQGTHWAANFNLATGALGSVTAGYNITMSIDTDPALQVISTGTWYRCTVYSSLVSATPKFYISNGDGVPNYQGDGTGTIRITKMQLTTSNVAGPYIKTTTSAISGNLRNNEINQNLFLQSEDLTTSWTPNKVTRTTTMLTDVVSTTDNYYIYQVISISGYFTISASVKAGTLTSFAFRIVGTNSTSALVYFDLNTITASAITLIGSISNCSTSIAPDTDLGTGWYRCTLSGQLGATSLYAYLYLAKPSIGYAADGTGTLYATKLQLTSSNVAGPYIKTTASTIGGNLRCQQSSQNLILQSEDMSVTWFKAPVSPIPISVTSTMMTDTVDASGTLHYVYQAITSAKDIDISYSVSAKAGTKSWICIGGNGLLAYFDVANGVIGSLTNTTATIAPDTSLGIGWYRCTMCGKAPDTNLNTIYFISNGDGAVTYRGDGTGTVYMTKFQVTKSNDPGPYVKTTTSTIVGNLRNSAKLLPYVNRLIDGDMELNNTSAWTVSNNALITKDSDVRTGSTGIRSLKVARNVTANPAATQTSLSVVGNNYLVRGWFRGDGSTFPYLAWSGGYVIATGTTSATWQYFETTSIASGRGVMLVPSSPADGAYCKFDDIEVIDLNVRSKKDNLVLDLQADMGISTVGGKVSNWADQTGRGNDVAQSNDAVRPTYGSVLLNGKPTITNADTNYLFNSNKNDLAPLNGVTVLVIGRCNIAAASEYPCGRGASGTASGYFITRVATALNTYVKANLATNPYTKILPLTEWHVFGLTYDGANVLSFMDGINYDVGGGATGGTAILANTGQISYGSETNFVVGNSSGLVAGRYWQGDIAAIRVWNCGLTPAEMLSESQILGTKWGLYI